MLKRILQVSFIMFISITIVGCSSQEDKPSDSTQQTTQNDTNTGNFDSNFTESKIPDINIQFGHDGKPLTMHFENNETALTIARNIGKEGKNLPIYNYDNFDNYEVMQYYDIPSSYTIPANPQTINNQKAGEVYYSSPNRIILFYQGANIPGEYTKIGTIENASDLKLAIENNPVQEGWNNKLVLIRFVD